MLGLLTVGHDVMEGWKPGCCLVRAQMFLLNQSKHLTWAHEGLSTHTFSTTHCKLRSKPIICSHIHLFMLQSEGLVLQHGYILPTTQCNLSVLLREGTKEVTWFIRVRERPCILDLPSPKNARLSSVHFPKKQEHLNDFKRDYFIGWPSVQN